MTPTEAPILFSLIVPCYNEAKNIPLIVEKLDQAFERQDIEVILVNNGSTDESARVMEEFSQNRDWLRVVTVETNQGYGFGILSGLKAGKGKFLGWTHADMQTDPSDPFKALKLLEDAKNPAKTYLKGLRKGRPFSDQLFTVGMSLFETLYMGCNLWDINAQPNVFPRTLLNDMQDPPHDFSLDLYFLFTARKLGYEIKRFEVLFPPRIHGVSSWNTGLGSKWKFIKRTIDFSLKLKKRLKEQP